MQHPDISRRKQAEERQRTVIQGLRNVLIVANELITRPDVKFDSAWGNRSCAREAWFGTMRDFYRTG